MHFSYNELNQNLFRLLSASFAHFALILATIMATLNLDPLLPPNLFPTWRSMIKSSHDHPCPWVVQSKGNQTVLPSGFHNLND